MPSLFTRLFGAKDDARAKQTASGWRQPERAANEAKYSRAAKLLAMHNIGMPHWTSRNNVELTRIGYERNAVCYRAVRMIAEAAASMPWLIYQGREEIVDHPVLDLVARPNPTETGVGFIEALCSNLLLYGNAYVEGAFIDGNVREIYALRPDRMSVTPGKNGWPSAYTYTAMGDQIRYDMQGEGIEPILHIKLFHPLDDYYGFAPLAAAQVALDTHNAASFWNKALLDNSARPSGALVYAGPEGAHLTDEQFSRLKEELEENFSGADNAGRPLLLEGGLDWKALSLSPKDMDFTEAKATAAREIALAFGVPPLLLGLPGDNTFKNYQEANRAFWRQTVIPLVARLQKSMHAWLQPGYEPFRFDYNADRIDALAEERASEWDRVGKAAFLTIDEQREAVGYGPTPKSAVFLKRSADDIERRYSPDQPRVPAGSSDGGQWTSGGGGSQIAISTDRNVTSDSSLLRPTQFDGFVDLAEEEGGDFYGHAIRDHVGKSDEYLKNRIRSTIRGNKFFGRADTRAGSFPSLEAANKLTNSVIARNRSIIEAVVNGEIFGPKRIDAFFGSPTGREAYLLRPLDPSVSILFRDTYGAAVVVVRTRKSKKGFSIITAFPIFD